MLEEAKQICPTTALRLAGEGALLVDVRERSEVAQLAFDVPVILNIPLSELEQRWRALPNDKEIVMVCEGGMRSLKATYFLQYQGFTRVSNMEGGILKWMRKGLPANGQRHGASTAGACGCLAGVAPASGADGCCGTMDAKTGTSAAACCGAAAPVGERSGCC